MKGFVKFMSSTAGRILRAVAGIALIAWGLIGLGDTTGYIVAAIGVLPLLTGVVDICVVAPLLGMPLTGVKCRAAQ